MHGKDALEAFDGAFPGRLDALVNEAMDRHPSALTADTTVAARLAVLGGLVDADITPSVVEHWRRAKGIRFRKTPPPPAPKASGKAPSAEASEPTIDKNALLRGVAAIVRDSLRVELDPIRQQLGRLTARVEELEEGSRRPDKGEMLEIFDWPPATRSATIEAVAPPAGSETGLITFARTDSEVARG